MALTPLPPSELLRHERALWRDGFARIAGVDEVGRGCLAGPVVAAAVILPPDRSAALRALHGVRDSKMLSPGEREDLLARLLLLAPAVGLGWASHRVIDREGIAAANRLALHRAIEHLPLRPDALLLDYFRLPNTSLPQVSLAHGDALSLSIAAASIVAKVVRDRWMQRVDARFPDYGFAAHKGYGTALHLRALARHGPCILHRRSFRPVASLL